MTPIIQKVTRKSMIIRPSGRSTDYISPSFGHGCLFDCKYCYMKRHKPEGLTIATNYGQILSEINAHAWFADVEKPNQTHESFITYDISCNEDFALHAKYHNWKEIFDFFKNHDKAMGSFATKYVNPELLKYNPNGKVRIRFSLMPTEYSCYLEPETSSISHRVSSINQFINAGYDVHVNFSPVIVQDGWLEHYELLFRMLNIGVDPKNKDKVKAEVIFLTHNEDKHKSNLEKGVVSVESENLLWKPEIQESKISQFGGHNIRYKHDLKAGYIQEWTELHDKIIPWNTIRYIF